VNTYKNQDVNTEATNISFFPYFRFYLKTNADTLNMDMVQRTVIRKIKSLENNTWTKVKETEIGQEKSEEQMNKY
jgi:hypothetical protein